MARALGETTITISVLDRLIDLEPESRAENQLSRSQSLRLVKAAVRRDLEWLLNSRRIADPPDENLKGAESLNLRLWATRSLRIVDGYDCR